MSTPSASPIVLHADQEHDRLRTAVILLLIFFFVLGYWLIRMLLRLEFWGALRDYAVSLSCVLGLVLALAITGGLELWLKRIWPSGRKLVLDDAGIRAYDQSTESQFIQWRERWTSLKWYFSLQGYRRGGREKRLPKRWLCLACQLQQGETRLIAHSYMPPEKAEIWLDNENLRPKFHQIQPGDVYESSWSTRLGAPARPQLSNEVLTGSDGRYWLVERHRWDEGFELTPNDFATFMDKVAEWQSDKVAK